MSKIKIAFSLVPVGLMALMIGCSGEAEISFNKDVKPILDENCLKCHVENGSGFVKTGLDMSSYENLMKGTKFGPIIEPGSSVSSTLARLISGNADPSLKMPHGAGSKPLSEGEIATIKAWIDQGAKNN